MVHPFAPPIRLLCELSMRGIVYTTSSYVFGLCLSSTCGFLADHCGGFCCSSSRRDSALQPLQAILCCSSACPNYYFDLGSYYFAYGIYYIDLGFHYTDNCSCTGLYFQRCSVPSMQEAGALIRVVPLSYEVTDLWSRFWFPPRREF